MIRKTFVFVMFLLLLPVAFAIDDDYFAVSDNDGPYTVTPGESFVVNFILLDKEVHSSEEVIMTLDPCPLGWECESKSVVFNTPGKYPMNLTVKVPDTESARRITTYIKLESDETVSRGMDRLDITIVDEKETVVDYDEYASRSGTETENRNPALASVSEPEKVQQQPKQEVAEPALSENVIPSINMTEVVEGVETLESSKSFVEYISVVLIVALVFILTGACFAFKRCKKK